MKHIFVINPAAGKEDSYANLQALLQGYEGKVDYELYATQAPGDATAYIRKRCTEHPNERMRFYACGGDGTLNEVVNGVVGMPNASLGCYPCGSGNDFVKYYGGAARFLDIDALLNATEAPIDVMRVGDRYSLNVTHFGFDTAVTRTMEKYRHKKLLGGKRAYTMGIAAALIGAMKNDCTVFVDGERLNDGKILLCTVSNGRYVEIGRAHV